MGEKKLLKYWNFDQILTFCGTLVTMLPDPDQICNETVHTCSTLTCQISSHCVHCVGFQWPKTTIAGKFWHVGLQYGPPFTHEGQICCARAYPCSRLTYQISSRSHYFLAVWWRKMWNFVILLAPAFCGVVSCRLSENVEHECTTTNLPLSNGIKIVSVLQRLHAKSGAQVLTFKSVTDRRTDRQTEKKLNVFGRPDGGWDPSPTKLGTWW